MKRKELEKILDEREARSKAKKLWEIYTKNTSLLIVMSFLILCIVFVIVFLLELSITIESTRPDGSFVAFGLAINFFVIMFLLIVGLLGSFFYLPTKIKNYRKQKFAEKFPDDAKYLE